MFAVVGFFTGDGPLCYLETHETMVVGGQMTRVVLLDTGAEVPPAQRGRFVTVEQVFTSIRAANQNELLDDVIVEYD